MSIGVSQVQPSQGLPSHKNKPAELELNRLNGNIRFACEIDRVELGLAQFLDRCFAIFVAFFDQHDRNIIANGILALAIGFLADQPGVFDECQPAGIFAGMSSFTTDAVGASQNFQQI
jgi:hypothetical protein